VVDGEESETAVIFRMEDDTLVTIEDDAEFERVRQVFESEDDESTTESGDGGPEVRSKSDSETSH
jgi:hypothetical protein